MRSFSFWTKLYILAVIAAALMIVVVSEIPLPTTNLALLAAISAMATLSLVVRVTGATDRSHYNFSFLFYSFALLVLDIKAAIIVILVSNLIEWYFHRYPWYIQFFNIASYIIALFAADQVIRAFNPVSGLSDLTSLIAVLLSLALFTLINHLMVGVVVWLARGENFRESGVLGLSSLLIDFSILSFGVVSALVWVHNPIAVLICLIPLYLIYTTVKVPALERKSALDPKTGLYNPEYFNASLKSELARAERFDHPLTVVMGDLDLLRNINNTYGHLAGDTVLIGIANVLRQVTRDYDVVARFGGEEFAILLPETTIDQAALRFEEIRAQFEGMEFVVSTSVNPIHATISFGIAGRAPGEINSPEDLVHRADLALYQAKLNGRNRVALHSELNESPFVITQREGYHPAESATQAAARQVEETAPKVEPVSAEGNPASETPQVFKQEQKVSRARPAMPVNVFIAAAVIVATIMMVSQYHRQPLDWLGVLIFSSIVVLTEWFSIDIYVRDSAVSTSAAPLLAGFLVLGPQGVLILSVTFAVVALIKHKSHISRFLFNASNQVIAGILCTLVVALTGRAFNTLPEIASILLTLACAVIVFLTTTAMLAFVIHITQEVPLSKVWYEQFSWLLPYYLALGILAYAFIYNYSYNGLFGILTILVPLFVLRRSQIQYINRTKEMVTELQEKNNRLESSSQVIAKLNEDLINALAEAIEMRDPYALGHSRHVSIYASMIAQKMNLSAHRVEVIRKAGLLHDVGKLGVPERILFKSERLSADEFEVMKSHSQLGAEIIDACASLKELVPGVLHHHEHQDGSGYPDHLRADAIPLEARILSVADAVEAMASDRPYRKALAVKDIIAELAKNSGRQFDPLVVEAFLAILRENGEDMIVNSAITCAPRAVAAQTPILTPGD